MMHERLLGAFLKLSCLLGFKDFSSCCTQENHRRIAYLPQLEKSNLGGVPWNRCDVSDSDRQRSSTFAEFCTGSQATQLA